MKTPHGSYDRTDEFSIDIDHRFVLTKKTQDADISLTIGPDGEPLGTAEVPKDSGKTHPYRQTELIEQVKAALGDEVAFNPYDVQCILKVHKVQKRQGFHCQSEVKNSPKQHRHQLVNWIVERYR